MPTQQTKNDLQRAHNLMPASSYADPADAERFTANPQQPGRGLVGNGVGAEGGERALREGRRAVLRADLKERIGVDPGRYVSGVYSSSSEFVEVF